jgi:hypothetical protein
MCTDFHAMALGEPHGVPHMVEIGAMEAACHIGDGDQRHDIFIVSHSVEAEGFSHIAVDDRHALLRHQLSILIMRPPSCAERAMFSMTATL